MDSLPYVLAMQDYWVHFTTAMTAGQGQGALSEASAAHALEVLRYQKLYVCTYLQHVGALLQIPEVWEGGVSAVRASQSVVGSRMPWALAADAAGLETFPTKKQWRVWDIVLGESEAAAGQSLLPPTPPVVFATVDELLGGDDDEAVADTSAAERELREEVGAGPVLSRSALKTLLLASPDLKDMQDHVKDACDASFDVSGIT